MQTTLEAREEILAELSAAIERVALATACLGQAFELLDEAGADRLEAELFRPVQRAYGRAKRAQSGFADRVGFPGPARSPPRPGCRPRA